MKRALHITALAAALGFSSRAHGTPGVAVAATHAGTATPLALAAPIAATEPPPPPLPSARLTAARVGPLLALEGPWRLALSLGARGDLGALPSFAVGASLRASLVRGRWRLFVDGSWRPTTRRALSPDARAGGDFDLFTVGLGACHRWVARPVTPAACASVEAGALAAEGFGVERPGRDRHPWIAAAAGGALELPVGAWLTLSTRAWLTVPLVRPDFRLVGVGDVFQPAPAGLRVELDAEVTF